MKNGKGQRWMLWFCMGLEREIDSDRRRAIFTPAGRLRRPKHARFVELPTAWFVVRLLDCKLL